MNSVPNGSALHLLMGQTYDPTVVTEVEDPELQSKLQDDFVDIYKSNAYAKMTFDIINKDM